MHTYDIVTIDGYHSGNIIAWDIHEALRVSCISHSDVSFWWEDGVIINAPAEW